MLRLALLAALCAGLSLCADDPPKKLSPEERKDLETKWREAMIAGGKAQQNGQIADAVKAVEEGLRHARQLYSKTEFPDGHRDLALSLNNLAALRVHQGNLADAEKLYRECLDVQTRLFPGDQPNTAQTLDNLAELCRALKRLPDAEKLCKDALEMRKRLFKGDHPDVAVSLDHLGAVYYSAGKLADAEVLGKEALEMRRRLFKGDHLDLARSMDNLAELYRSQGKLADAEPLQRASLEMQRRLFKEDHPRLVRSLQNLATLYHTQGRLAEAEPVYTEVLAMQRRLVKGDHPTTAGLLISFAYLCESLGKPNDAESLYKDALAMQRRLHKGDHPDLAQTLHGLARYSESQRRLADAERLYKEALAMYRRLYKGEHPNAVSSMNNLANLLNRQGKITEAEQLLGESLVMTRRLFPGDHREVALTLNTQASFYMDQGKLADAVQLHKDALAMQRRLVKGDHPETAALLYNLANAYCCQGRLSDAEPLYQDVLAMRRRLLSSYAMQKTEGEAITFSELQRYTSDAYLSLVRTRSGDPTNNYDLAAAYAAVWKSKGMLARVFEQRHLRARAASADPAAAKILAELADARRRRAELLFAPPPRDAATYKKREEDLRACDATITRLNATLPGLLPLIPQIEKLDAATPADLQKALPADAAVVDFSGYSFFEYDNTRPAGEKLKETQRYLAFVVTRGRVTLVDLDTVARTDPALVAWRQAITGGKDIPPELPARVRELVWEKVRKELPAEIKTVYIAPDWELGRVPWGALPGDKPGTILLEDYAIATIPHAAFLLEKLGPQDPLKNPPSGALVVGGVNFDAEATTGPANRDLPVKPGAKAAWPALPGAAAEATGVETAAKKKGTVTALRGEAATPAAVLAALPKVKHAHFATHGFFADPKFCAAFQLNPWDFERSQRGERVGRAVLSPLVMTGLVFAGANNPKTPGRGIVTGESLVDLDLSGLELAVLSACETGLGDVVSGEGTLGLQRAFHLAGTRDVVASLWKVPDAPTAALMAEFYRNLWEKNLSPLESLRQAQLFIYRNPGRIAELAAGFRAGFKEVKGDEIDIKPTADGKAHPKQWAAFTLSGPGR